MVGFLKKSGWLVVDIAAFLVAFAFFAAILVFAMGKVLSIELESIGDDNFINDPFLLLALYIPLLVSSTSAAVIVHRSFFKRPIQLLGLGHHRFWKDYTWGWVLGAFLVLIGFVILVATDQLEIISYEIENSIIIGYFLFFLVQSCFEEILFRSYLMPAVQFRFGWAAALLLSSIAFALVHTTNSNVSALGIINVFLAGILFGLLFMKYSNVWAASGLHFSWNYIQSAILGFNVSGEETSSVLVLEEKGNDLVTGGPFGYEGSMVAALLLFALITYYLKNDTKIKDMLEGGSSDVAVEDFS